jgi:COP9 signalosome complex subunit 3
MEAAPRWNIKRLTDTYLSLSLTEIGNEVGISSEPAVRALVISMVCICHIWIGRFGY